MLPIHNTGQSPVLVNNDVASGQIAMSHYNVVSPALGFFRSWGPLWANEGVEIFLGGKWTEWCSRSEHQLHADTVATTTRGAGDGPHWGCTRSRLLGDGAKLGKKLVQIHGQVAQLSSVSMLNTLLIW